MDAYCTIRAALYFLYYVWSPNSCGVSLCSHPSSVHRFYLPPLLHAFAQHFLLSNLFYRRLHYVTFYGCYLSCCLRYLVRLSSLCLLVIHIVHCMQRMCGVPAAFGN